MGGMPVTSEDESPSREPQVPCTPPPAQMVPCETFPHTEAKLDPICTPRGSGAERPPAEGAALGPDRVPP